MNKSILLLKNLLLSTSQSNIYRHSTDPKKKSRVVGNAVGMLILYLMLMAYCVANCIGYGKMGIIDIVPILCALTVSILAFFFTFLKSNGYLFAFKEYDMLMALPFSVPTVAACRFLYMYVKSLPWYLSVSLAMLIGYGVYAKAAIAVYPLWILLSLFLPLIPMLLASFLGFLIAKIGSGFKKKNLVQTVLTFILILAAFGSRFVIESVMRNGKVEEVLKQASEMAEETARYFPPALWFANAVTKFALSDILLLVGISIFLFGVVFAIVGANYRKINSALKSHEASKDFRLTSQKKNSVVNAIAFKEFKRMTGSTVYLTNVGMGEILAALFGICVLIFGFDRIVSTVTSNAPMDPAILRPAIPFIVYFFLGMMSTCACSPSLEGKNYWIVQSLPVEKKTLYQGKMLYNMYLTVPFMFFSTICVCISAQVSLIDTILYLVLGFCLLAFSTAWGCVCGMRHMRLDWENEVEVIKQGTAVMIYMFPNMFVCMGLVVGSVFLGMAVDHTLLALCFILIVAILALLSYRRVMILAQKNAGL
ncbi:MAG: hypothetical protein IK115_04030 [Lachnospiraceae bacterium]|nr:hypothetical protein [Lachnospiraceae bacterium]